MAWSCRGALWGFPLAVGLTTVCQGDFRGVAVVLAVGLAVAAVVPWFVMASAMGCHDMTWALPRVAVVCYSTAVACRNIAVACHGHCHGTAIKSRQIMNTPLGRGGDLYLETSPGSTTPAVATTVVLSRQHQGGGRREARTRCTPLRQATGAFGVYIYTPTVLKCLSRLVHTGYVPSM